MNRTFLFAALVALGATACWPSSSRDAEEEEVEQLQKQVTVLKKRLKQVESRSKASARPGAAKAKAKAKAGKSKGGKASPARRPTEKVAVDLAGDATKAALSFKGKRAALPGQVPVGSYNIVAEFPGGDSAIRGKVDVKKGEPLLVTCTAATESCEATAK